MTGPLGIYFLCKCLILKRNVHSEIGCRVCNFQEKLIIWFRCAIFFSLIKNPIWSPLIKTSWGFLLNLNCNIWKGASKLCLTAYWVIALNQALWLVLGIQMYQSCLVLCLHQACSLNEDSTGDAQSLRIKTPVFFATLQSVPSTWDWYCLSSLSACSPGSWLFELSHNIKIELDQYLVPQGSA